MSSSRYGHSHNGRFATPASSTYFQSSLESRTESSGASESPHGPQRVTDSIEDARAYTPSLASARPSTSYSTVSRATRPSTASRRRPRTGTSASILGLSEQQNVVCALAEARGVTPSVGVAFVNVSLGEVVLSQICDNQAYVKTIHKIQMASPSRVVFMSTACPPVKNTTLFSLVQELVPDATSDAFDRAAWSENEGYDHIQNLAPQSDVGPIKVALQGKYYAVCSFAAAMKYIDHQFTISFAPHSLRIRYQPSEDTMMIDVAAIRSLEIMQNAHNSKSKESLYGLLNHTCTPMGARMLRRNILQPPTGHETFLGPRFDALEELTKREELFREVRKALKPFHDVEKLLTKLIIVPTGKSITLVEEQISQVLMLKGFLEAVPKLFVALAPVQSALLVKVRELCCPEVTGPMLANIQRVIEPDVKYMRSPLDLRNQRTFAVRSGINGMLDVARQTYKELTEEIHQHVDELQDGFKIAVALKFDNGRKYWLRIKAIDFDYGSPPPLFVNVVRKKDNIECQTLDLIKLNVRLSDASNEVVIRSDAVIQDLIADLRRTASQLFKVCESVALIDMLASFAQLSMTRDYVRPDITSTLALKAARHPILDKSHVGDIVPNDYYASEQHCFHIITGCNMSGKSTYIRAVALLQIMAQVGCFVPAEYAAFPIIHNIFARVSMDDNVEASLSTFSVEMREMAFILRNIDGKSLAIIDELGRGTSTRDGLAIAIAMSEALIQTGASVWFATHFIELAKVLGERPGVLNLHLASTTAETSEGLPLLQMLYKATAGTVNDKEHYGIHLARAMGFPPSFIDKAEEVANDLRQKREANRQSSESRKLVARRKLLLNLHEALRQARDAGSDESLPGYLRSLQAEFAARMEGLDSVQ
ncbi:MutS protein msh4 [Purpureocillium takamizusanense]|uniref:DNA mismatch repair protein MSH3 n=1 Tax=Purpureocillium takamizusanense TaxID=2060973 RepID=A0A9Q8QCI7_9HYPO|nr:MutS protein msh4 [Purpureocillium takamizusanense]UNI17140.1 MutS protein msh4 [Purpureocillium takamizusanense]